MDPLQEWEESLLANRDQIQEAIHKLQWSSRPLNKCTCVIENPEDVRTSICECNVHQGHLH